MSLIQEILSESNGALFRRADLHIHSFGDGGSYDVTDATMTPEGIRVHATQTVQTLCRPHLDEYT